MKSRFLLFTTACIFIALVFSGCHTSRKAVARSSRQPKFIDDVYMNGHTKGHVTVSGAPGGAKSPNANKPGQADNTDGPQLSKREISGIRKKYAEIMGVKPKDISNNALYQFIDEWYGTNYQLGGGDHGGIDCSGFAKKLYGEVYGIDLSRTAAEQFANCKKIKHTGDASEGDLVFFHVRSRHITHVGIYLANDYFVHASTSQGVVISNLHDDYWQKYYAGMGRVER